MLKEREKIHEEKKFERCLIMLNVVLTVGSLFALQHRFCLLIIDKWKTQNKG